MPGPGEPLWLTSSVCSPQGWRCHHGKLDLGILVEIAACLVRLPRVCGWHSISPSSAHVFGNNVSVATTLAAGRRWCESSWPAGGSTGQVLPMAMLSDGQSHCPSSVSDLERSLRHVVDALQRRHVRFAVVGGMAIAVRAEPRLTRDADLAIRRRLRRRGRSIDLELASRRVRGVCRRGARGDGEAGDGSPHARWRRVRHDHRLALRIVRHRGRSRRCR